MTETTPVHPPYFIGERISIVCSATGYPNLGLLYISNSSNPRSLTGQPGCATTNKFFTITEELIFDLGLGYSASYPSCRHAAQSVTFTLELIGPITDALKDRQLYCHVYNGTAYESPVPLTVISDLQG